VCTDIVIYILFVCTIQPLTTYCVSTKSIIFMPFTFGKKICRVNIYWNRLVIWHCLSTMAKVCLHDVRVVHLISKTAAFVSPRQTTVFALPRIGKTLGTPSHSITPTGMFKKIHGFPCLRGGRRNQNRSSKILIYVSQMIVQNNIWIKRYFAESSTEKQMNSPWTKFRGIYGNERTGRDRFHYF